MIARNNVFGERLHEALESKGITQRDLAKRVGLSEVSVSRYVRGDRRPDTDMLREISLVTGIATDWLLGIDDMKPIALTYADVKAIKKPMLLWQEDRYTKRLFPVECLGIHKVKLSGESKKSDVVMYAEGMEDVETYGMTYRLWTLKPSVEQMQAACWNLVEG